MTNLTVEILLCVVLLGGAYILFGQQYLSGGSAAKASSKKKKRSKANKKGKTDGAADDAPSTVNGAAKKSLPGQAGGSSVNVKANNADRKAPLAAAKQQGAETLKPSSERGQSKNARNNSNTSEEDEDFPPLQAKSSSGSATNGRKAVNGSARTLNGSGHQQKPLAERPAKPRPVTAVDDMVEKDDPIQGQKIFSRTMRIVKPSEEKPLLLDDEWPEDDEAGDYYAPQVQKEEAWQSVPSSKKASTIRITSSHPQTSKSTAATTPSVPGLPELTKKQRQNARKAELARVAKEEAEQERLQRLAAHKRQLEGERMTEQYKQRSKQQQQQQSKLPKRQEVGGGMQAAVHDGKLIWE